MKVTKEELKAQFPWLGTDEEANGADVVDALNELYGAAAEEKATALLALVSDIHGDTIVGIRRNGSNIECVLGAAYDTADNWKLIAESVRGPVTVEVPRGW